MRQTTLQRRIKRQMIDGQSIARNAQLQQANEDPIGLKKPSTGLESTDEEMVWVTWTQLISNVCGICQMKKRKFLWEEQLQERWNLIKNLLLLPVRYYVMSDEKVKWIARLILANRHHAYPILLLLLYPPPYFIVLTRADPAATLYDPPRTIYYTIDYRNTITGSSPGERIFIYWLCM